MKEWRGDGWRVASRWNQWEKCHSEDWVNQNWRDQCMFDGSWFQRRGEAYWKEGSVIRREDDVDGRSSVTKDEERVLQGAWTVMQIRRLKAVEAVNWFCLVLWVIDTFTCHCKWHKKWRGPTNPGSHGKWPSKFRCYGTIVPGGKCCIICTQKYTSWGVEINYMYGLWLLAMLLIHDKLRLLAKWYILNLQYKCQSVAASTLHK